MASIRLGRYEVKEYELPPLCAKCGAPAVARPAKTFAWHPPWIIVLIFVGLLIYAIVAVILTKRMTVPLPLCQRHRRYWVNRLLIIYGGILGLLLLGGGAFALVGVLLHGREQDDAWGWACAGTAVLGLIWLFTAGIVHALSIKPNEITDNSITLTGLSRDFVDAVRADRRADRDDEDEEDDEDYDRPRRSRRRDEEEDDRPRRRRDADDDGGYYDPEARRRVRRRDDDERDDR